MARRSYRNTTALETQMFAQRKSDYIWTLVNLGLAIFITNYPLGSVVFWHAFLSGLTYLVGVEALPEAEARG